MDNDRIVPRDGQRAEGAARTVSAWSGRLVVSLALLLATIAFYANVYPLHHDLAGSLLSGQLSVELGDEYAKYSLYAPPAERLWNSLAVLVGNLIGLRIDLALIALSTLVVLIGCELAYRIRRATVGASLWFFVVPAAMLVVLPILYKNIFGLREPLIAAGLWPYVVLRLSDPDGTRVGWKTRALVGAWVGSTLLFKYLYAAVVVFVELADAIVQRRPRLLFRLENLIAGAIVALYLMIWLVADAANRAALHATMSAIDGALADRATTMMMVVRNLAYAAAFFMLARVFKMPARAIAIGLALVLGALVAALAQQRWFTHHLFLIVMAYFTWWWMASRIFPAWAQATIAFAIGSAVFGEFIHTKQYRDQVTELDKAMSAADVSLAGKRVGVLNMHPSPINQYLASHRAQRWSTTPNIAYVATELRSFDVPRNRGKPVPPITLVDPGRRLVHDKMLQLWEDQPPDALIFDEGMRWPLRFVDVRWAQVYALDPRFNAFLRHYRRVFSYNGEQVAFTYYVRAD